MPGFSASSEFLNSAVRRTARVTGSTRGSTTETLPSKTRSPKAAERARTVWPGLSEASRFSGTEKSRRMRVEVVEGRDARARRHIGAERDGAGAEPAREGGADDEILQTRLGGLALASAEAMALSSVFTCAVRSSTWAPVPAPVRRSAWARSRRDGDFVALRLGAADLGDGGLDVGAALVGVEAQQHVAGLDLLALLEADLLDAAGNLGGDGDRFEGPHGADRLVDLDDTAGLDNVHVDDDRPLIGAAPARGRRIRCRSGRGNILSNDRHVCQPTGLVGIPPTVSGRPENGDDRQLSIPAQCLTPASTEPGRSLQAAKRP